MFKGSVRLEHMYVMFQNVQICKIEVVFFSMGRRENSKQETWNYINTEK